MSARKGYDSGHNIENPNDCETLDRVPIWVNLRGHNINTTPSAWRPICGHLSHYKSAYESPSWKLSEIWRIRANVSKNTHFGGFRRLLEFRTRQNLKKIRTKKSNPLENLNYWDLSKYEPRFFFAPKNCRRLQNRTHVLGPLFSHTLNICVTLARSW